MKNWKDKVLGILAGIGIMSLLMASSSNTNQSNNVTPESHIWEMHSVAMQGTGGVNASRVMVYSYNKVTGEVRKHETAYIKIGGKDNAIFGAYEVTSPY